MLSQKAKYALQAMAYLASHHSGKPVLMPEIAEKKKIPLRFLENIMHELKKHGLLQSYRGRQGGYALAKPPDQITLAQVIRLVDGPIAMLSCVSLHFYKRCEACREDACGLHDVMVQARDAVLQVVENKTLLDIVDKG